MARDDAAQRLREFEDDGFTIFRGVLDGPILEEADRHLHFLSEAYPRLRPEHYHHPLMRDDAFWVRLLTDPRLLDIAELFLGPNLACFTSHYICKPPGDGQAVLPHQDGAYWKLSPMNAVTLWLAIDSSTPENGCLKMYRGTHRLPLQQLSLRDDVPNMLFSQTEMELREEDAVEVVLQPGDVSVHNPFIVHGSGENRSARRRCGLDMGFIPTSTRVAASGVYMHPLLVRGEAMPGVNRYRPWPTYDPTRTIAFEGCEAWNEDVARRNLDAAISGSSMNEPSPIALTEHMIDRLRAGTTAE